MVQISEPLKLYLPPLCVRGLTTCMVWKSLVMIRYYDVFSAFYAAPVS